jgi:hypothetical protein
MEWNAPLKALVSVWQPERTCARTMVCSLPNLYGFFFVLTKRRTRTHIDAGEHTSRETERCSASGHRRESVCCSIKSDLLRRKLRMARHAYTNSQSQPQAVAALVDLPLPPIPRIPDSVKPTNYLSLIRSNTFRINTRGRN